jgi:ketol-acid reductoisomerase
MRIDIQCDRRVSVSSPCGYHVYRHATSEQVSNVRVPQSMKGHMRQVRSGDFATELFRKVARVAKLSIPCREDEIP